MTKQSASFLLQICFVLMMSLSLVMAGCSGSGSTSSPQSATLAITTSSQLSGAINVSFSTTLSASGGTAPYTWSVVSGALPVGMTLSSTGVISGTPGATGSFSFTVQVKDATSQTANQVLSLTIASTAPAPLAITTSSLVAGNINTSYSATLAATGGTTPYTWSVSSGALPAGVGLSSAGIISGTPTASGSFSFTVQLSDAAKQIATKGLTLSISATPLPLSITTTSIPGGTVGFNFSATLAAKGGTTPYTWTLASGALPAGLQLQTSGAITGLPNTVGQTTFTVKVTDSASHTATAPLSINILAAPAANTWFLRPDGGTAAQCDGRTDAAYPGSGTNQHCAFNNPHYLWGNDVSGEKASWKIAGGDTVIIKNGSYRLGFKGPNSGDSWGQCPGDPFNCTMPPIPSGSASQHTKILGENSANCTVMPELHGGFGLFEVLALEGSSNVDIQCLEITDHSSCGKSGTGNLCNTSFPLDDFATHAVITDVNTKNVTLTDLNIHGLASDGIFGPVGGGFTAKRVRIAGNPSSGWNFDDGNSTQTTGTVTMSFVTVEWNGCAEVYPPTNPPSYDHCFDDNSGGYGDGVGTPNTGGAFLVDHSTFRYNTQDGLDLLHVDEAGAVITIVDSIAYGNMGNQFKQGAAAATFQNNVVMGNCKRLQSAFAPNPSTFNKNLSDFCRANGDAVVIGTNDNAHAVIQNNSVTSNFSIAFDIQCLAAGGGTGACTNASHVNFDNNLIYGFADASGVHTFITGIFEQGASGDFMSNTGGTRRNNLLFHTNDTCGGSPAVGEVCADPLLTSETDINTMDFHLTITSPARIKGLIIPSLTTDFDGKLRPIGGVLYDIGAFQF
ncbi:MAG TPA: putative Ig domain-containing protein [Candidatus Angelobacter sp.]|nr:putative Ig domain-containing protein [Candidatus Angelobacter sp.]